MGHRIQRLPQPGNGKDEHRRTNYTGGKVHHFHRLKRHTARNAFDGMGLLQVDGTDRSAMTNSFPLQLA